MEKLEQFRKLGLGEKTIKALSKKGYEEPTPIQALTIPALLTGDKDVIGQAQTGTGKTAAFSLPILENFESDGTIQAIVLAPTRELALQVAEEMNSLASGKKIRITPVYGGQSIEFQIRQLKKGTDIVVGTPGRVMDLMDRKLIKLKNLKYFILDEADEMLNMGFVEDIEKILEATNEDKRMLFFSATMPAEIIKIAKRHMKDYEILAVKARELTTDLTDQIYFEVNERDKFEALCRIIDLTKDFYGIVFCRTKNDANDLVGRLNDRGYDAEGLHGDISQNYREVTLKRFKAKKINILVATDVAARGIDVNDLSHVINYSIPQEAESYVHRIGRTGRAGKEGTAITFITPKEYRRLLQIQKAVKTEIRKAHVPEVKDVIQAKKFRLIDELNDILAQGDYDNFKDFAKELLSGENSVDLVAALLKHSYDDILDENNYNEIGEVKLEKSGKVRLFIALGKKDNMTAKKLVDYIINKSKVDSRKIRNVEVFESFSFVSVPFLEAETILSAFQEEKNGKKPLIEKAKEKSKDRDRKSKVADRGPRRRKRDNK
ncbi:DEAD-box ATP-dependent RNA helicase CshA [Fusobacterium sp. DD29]|uniref:DEAD/DEAH box helicase n=1 Tax=unclassified Fusobacterium TaxID=2648384 RepID=UPI001B8D6C63|nr:MULTISPECIES: DEAD/DEAH box helicase [unclassified Fusobacterium]MBR8701032.1 DEAD-box ATP-dependent RNA helicase CshA [Fusobacterium sp. DD45]MBR8710804.1 DEAD-box ATP-dependent RNA helicase CshA [Fusobacterium sp. DD28]MBR8750018.1 DEAD-box ATP-dependent RNA helicase CshA [Fusobacterium sp. DD29]MBR8751418.1 DEAD-box ATP-dependent RNA helicase CshA [Fusobacterium sp. DD26]MBR8762246.1 DEAD-box ATP-dependent RNA helicase CshA [Fusobacterium sp. DD25]